jgi:hypothetical protein
MNFWIAEIRVGTQSQNGTQSKAPDDSRAEESRKEGGEDCAQLQAEEGSEMGSERKVNNDKFCSEFSERLIWGSTVRHGVTQLFIPLDTFTLWCITFGVIRYSTWPSRPTGLFYLGGILLCVGPHPTLFLVLLLRGVITRVCILV